LNGEIKIEIKLMLVMQGIQKIIPMEELLKEIMIK
jgi:hypothetical protein